MIKLEIGELTAALTGELAETGDWVIANLETAISWPVSYQAYAYAGRRYFVIPLTKGRAPAVAVRRDDESLQSCRSALLRFLSAMSWTQSAGAIVTSFSSDSLPRPQQRTAEFGMIITGDLNLNYLPVPSDATSALALALMREGRGLNHPAYAFLSFYRVLEAAIPHGKTRENWLADNLDLITDHSGREALEKLREAGINDVGAHLYKSGRMAIAHAQADPIVNPDDAADYDRISSELPIMRGLAELAIESILGVKTRSTVYREHLYELAGFKERLGAGPIAMAIAGATGEDQKIDIPVIDVELRRREAYAALKGLRPVEISVAGAIMRLHFRSPDELVELRIGLDFENERLLFSWDSDIGGLDDGSVAAAEHGADVVRFILEYIGNGELHIYESETRKLLGRVDAFLPNNYFANHEGLNARIEAWRTEAEKRRAAAACSNTSVQTPSL